MKGGTRKMKGNEEQGNLDSWDGFLGSNFLNAEDVKDENHIFIVVGIELDTENNRPIFILESGDIKAKFSLNVTNANFVKNAGIKSPRNAVGKKVRFRKVMVRSPKTKQEVESLRIVAIE